MKQPTDIDISEFRSDRPLIVLFDAPDHLTFRTIRLFYFFAGLAHLWLADAWQMTWIPGNILFASGLLLLLFRPGALAFLLAALGKLLPLLFARDHLVQSLLLFLFASSGALFLGLRAYLSTWPDRLPIRPSSYGDVSPHLLAIFDTLKYLTAITYALAAFHKINRDFFTPEISCATHGINRLATYFHLPAYDPGIEGLALAIFVIALEASIPLLYLLGRRRLAILAAVAFHLPLTLTMAPAFAFVMLVGHAAFFRPADILHLRNTFQRHRILLVLLPVATTAFTALMAAPIHDWTLLPREFLLWFLGYLFLFSGPLPSSPTPRAPLTLRIRTAPRLVALVFATGFLLTGLLPYTGLRFQHSGAMVSNLRIDEGCWNHLLIPEALRIHDPYIRVDDVYLGAPGRLPRYESIVLDQLWNPPMIRQMQKHWCRAETRPFYLAGSYKNRLFQIPDLCDLTQPLPFEDAGFFGPELFPEHLRFQRNLPRQCPARCIH